MSTIPAKQFTEFLSYFPKSALPLTIQYTDHHSYSKSNDSLPDTLLQQFILPNLDFEVDEFTEFLPCLQFESVEGMNHLVLWTARLMHYSFYLLNFNAGGSFLGMAEIAGFYTKDQQLLQKMAHVDAEGNIYLVEGSINENAPDQTKKWQMEILPDGLLNASVIEL